MSRQEFERNYFSEEQPEIQSECGLFAVYARGPDVRSMAYQAATALQHRAEGAAGMYVSNGDSFDVVRELGTVAVAFQEGRNLPNVENPHIAIVHTRYPTAGSANHRFNIHPMEVQGVWLTHHGNLTNAEEIKEKIGQIPVGGDYPDSDSWVAVNAIAGSPGESLAEKVINAQRGFEGGWVFIVTDGKTIIASRDPHGIRPLSIGYLGSKEDPKGYVLSVESCAFNNFDVSEFHEVLPGETIQIDDNGVKTIDLNPRETMGCLFEFVYMSRPDSKFMGELVHDVRRKAGSILWDEAPVDLSPDEKLVIMPVPNSGRSAALGYFHAAQKTLGLRVSYDEGILANSYFGRNFIKSSEERAAYLKFYPIPPVIEGKVVGIVDDSIVRGDTTPELVNMCLEANAKEVHLRIASPEIRHPCFWGVAFPTFEELLANKIPDIKDREAYLKCQTLRHLSLGGLLAATEVSKNKFCTHCFNGHGPSLASQGTITLSERSARR